MGYNVMTSERVSCNACKKDSFELVFTDRKTGYGHGYCKGCGLIYMNPRMDAASRGSFYTTYAQKYPDSFLLYQGNDLWQCARMRAEFLKAFLKVSGFCPKSLLEVGCSYGLFLKELDGIKLGIDAHGIEPSAVEREFAVRVMKVRNVSSCVIEDAPRPASGYDMVALFHVLEHVGDPMAALRRIYELLQPGGLLWAEVPDASGLKGDFIEYHHFISCQHLYTFSKITLNGMLERAGFEKVLLESAPLSPNFQNNLRAVYRKRAKGSDAHPEKDRESGRFLSEFHDRVNALKGDMERWLETQARRNKTVFIYGGGFHTLGVLGFVDFSNCRMGGIIDDDPAKHGSLLEGIPVVSPSVLEQREPGAVLISTLAGERAVFERISPLADRGWEIKAIYGGRR